LLEKLTVKGSYTCKFEPAEWKAIGIRGVFILFCHVPLTNRNTIGEVAGNLKKLLLHGDLINDEGVAAFCASKNKLEVLHIGFEKLSKVSVFRLC